MDVGVRPGRPLNSTRGRQEVPAGGPLGSTKGGQPAGDQLPPSGQGEYCNPGGCVESQPAPVARGSPNASHQGGPQRQCRPPGRSSTLATRVVHEYTRHAQSSLGVQQ